VIERDEVFRLKTDRTPGTLARALTRIGEHGASVAEIETLHVGPDHNIREVTVVAPGDDAVVAIARALADEPGVEVVEQSIDKVFAVHEGGKLDVVPRVEVRNLQDMREVYTPGVARVSNAIVADPALASRFTWKGRTVAIVSDGSRVLGLGDIGPVASLPVMEGKALFYSMLVGLNAVPIVLDTSEPTEIVDTVARIAPGFGGIHLEDIATPGVYEVERALQDRLEIPVMHDDQHGTAVVLLAAVLSAARRLQKPVEDLTFGQVGLGAAGSAIAHLALSFPFERVIAYDPGEDAVARLRGLGDGSTHTLEATSDGAGLEVALDADVLVMTTGQAGLLDPDRVRSGQVVAALTNPIPEIDPDAALRAGASIATDGSIVNNVLAYPGLFRGALDARAPIISTDMKRAAAIALSELAENDRLLPDPLDPTVHETVAARVAAAS